MNIMMARTMILWRNIMNEVAICMSGTALLLSLLTCVFSILAYTETIGLKKSTHKVQWVPIAEDDRGPIGKELKKNMNDAFKEDENDIY